MTTLYESDDVAVTAMLGETEEVIVTFSNFGDEGGEADRKGVGGGLVTALGRSGIFLVAKTNHWWQIEDRDAFCEAVRRASAGYRLRTGYGSSMGGYGALSMGAAMGCTRLLVIAPQTVISDPDVDLNPDWKAAIDRRPILRDTIAEDLGDLVPEIVFDPRAAQDNSHVAYLRKRHPVSEVCFPFAGHKLLLTFKQCGVLDHVIRALLRGGYDLAELQAHYAEHQFLSERVLRNIGMFQLERNNVAKARALVPRLAAIGAAKASADLERQILKRERVMARDARASAH